MESSKYITRHIDRLLLDPNNYRFIDNRDYQKIDDAQAADPRIQLRTYNFLAGRNDEHIRDLIGSFKANGLLKLDPIQVKETEDSKYIVVEGNRRTAALKYLYNEFKQGNDVGKLTETSFKSIDVILTSGESPTQHLITMGLHHISGKKRWTPVNQAQLVYDLRYEHNQSEDDIIDSLGISKQSLRRSLRTLSFIKAYKDSDFGDQFHPTKYSIFEEVIKTPSVKEWLGWDDNTQHCTNELNQQKLFSWISDDDSPSNDTSENDDLISRQAIITKSHEIRDLGEFIHDQTAVAKMEASRSITTGFALSEAVAEQKFQNAIENLAKDVNIAFQYSEHMSADDLDKISNLRDKLEALSPSSKAVVEKSEIAQLETVYPDSQKHFKSLTIKEFGKLKDVNITQLSQINIVAGGNNMGKTTLLEAVYISTQLNHLLSFVEQERYRGKFYKALKTHWLNQNFITDVSINSVFNDAEVNLRIYRTNKGITEDKTHYLTSLCSEAEVNGNSLYSLLHLFNNREPEIFYEKRRVLCRAAFTSPFRFNEEQLARAYDHAISEKHLDSVVTFIRDNIDARISAFDMSSDKRFLVTSTQFKQAIDITKFGEGLQRVFEIALLMAYCKNGVLCVDEVDAAIHKSLLINFTKFIQLAAKQFNVQVFMSTHSKECIDAFIQNGMASDITAYALTEKDGAFSCRFLAGEKLDTLITSVDFDIR